MILILTVEVKRGKKNAQGTRVFPKVFVKGRDL
jgi:hypothetical protein